MLTVLGVVSLSAVAVISMLRSGNQEPVRKAAGPLEIIALPGSQRHRAAQHGVGSREVSPRFSRVSLALYREAVTEIHGGGTFPPVLF